MTRMLKITLGLSVAALSLGGIAYAQTSDGPPPSAHARPGMACGKTGPAMMDKPETRAEAKARAERMFDRLDVNHDGKFDAADRMMMRQQHREKQFEKLDTNHDGSISKQEFMAGAGPRGPGNPHEGRAPHGCGPDMHPHHGAGGMMPPPPGGPQGDMPPPPPGADGAMPPPPPGAHHGPGKDRMKHRGPAGMMGMFGPDGKSSITRAEFVANALKRFDSMDANHDGTVTQAERQAAFKKMKMEHGARHRMGDRPDAPQQAPGN